MVLSHYKGIEKRNLNFNEHQNVSLDMSLLYINPVFRKCFEIVKFILIVHI